MWSRREIALGVEGGGGGWGANLGVSTFQPPQAIPSHYLPLCVGLQPTSLGPALISFHCFPGRAQFHHSLWLEWTRDALPPPPRMPSPWSRLRPPPVAPPHVPAQVRHPFSAALSGPSPSPPHSLVHGLVLLVCSDILSCLPSRLEAPRGQGLSLSESQALYRQLRPGPCLGTVC